jgi:hypothetical protein
MCLGDAPNLVIYLRYGTISESPIRRPNFLGLIIHVIIVCSNSRYKVWNGRNEERQRVNRVKKGKKIKNKKTPTQEKKRKKTTGVPGVRLPGIVPVFSKDCRVNP